MALTRSKRCRGQKVSKPGRKPSKNGDDSDKTTQRDSPNIYLEKESNSEGKIGQNSSIPPSRVQVKAAVSINGAVDVPSAVTLREERAVTLMGDPLNAWESNVDNSGEESNDNCPQFIIDSQPDFKLMLDDDDSDHVDASCDGDFSQNENFTSEKLAVTSDCADHLERDDSQLDLVPEAEDDSSKTTSKSLTKKRKETQSESNSKEKSTPSLEAPCEIDVGFDLGDCYINLDGEDPMSSKTAVQTILLKSQQDKLIKKSVLTPDFEKRDSIPPYKVAARQLKKQRKRERESTKGAGWFDMKATEMTDELRNDLKVLRMRSTLDPKRFYKANDMTAVPKFVQVGTVVDNPVDFYHSRVPKKQRKQTLVEELLSDADSRRYNKRKYLELQEKFNSFTKGGKKRKFGKSSGGRKR